MSRRRSTKKHSVSRENAAKASPSLQTEVVEFQQLLTDIRFRLSRLPEKYGEPMSIYYRQRYANTRPFRSPARVEAEALYHLVQVGKDSIENVRQLINVPASLEQSLHEVRLTDPRERKQLQASLRFRRQVLSEFESLIVEEKSAAATASMEAPSPSEATDGSWEPAFSAVLKEG